MATPTDMEHLGNMLSAIHEKLAEQSELLRELIKRTPRFEAPSGDGEYAFLIDGE